MKLERNQIRRHQDGEQHNSTDVPLGLFNDLTASLLPQPSDVGGWSPGVTTDQIARSNRAGQIGALGQMRSLIPRGKNAAVATWSWSAPGAVLGLFGEEGERPLGVNAFDRAQTQSVAAQNVFNYYLTVGDTHLWGVEGDQGKVAKQQGGWQAVDCCCETKVYQGDAPTKQQHTDACAGEHPGESRAKDLHVTTLTRSKEVWVG